MEFNRISWDFGDLLRDHREISWWISPASMGLMLIDCLSGGQKEMENNGLNSG